jgi:predicted Fe-S protein YdhL (DUF1289 family)|tara:strand:- start:1110 stop:1565 length:456 start_codon:yes stop_codon:yes gene_type:complete
MRKSVKTPCIGVCSTVFGDEVCRGCKRFQHEIIEWNSFNDSEKTSVLNRLESLKVQILQSKIQLLDKNLLRDKLLHYKIKFDDDRDPLCWVFDLLRSGSQSILDPTEFGFDLLTSSALSLSELKKIIEEELFELSEAHYQRYFKVEKYLNV